MSYKQYYNSRQYPAARGAREIGELLAKEMDIPYYDRELTRWLRRKAVFRRKFTRILTKPRQTVFCTRFPPARYVLLPFYNAVRSAVERQAVYPENNILTI